MFSTVTGALLYVLALFPGVAYEFAREGHRARGRRSALRELAEIVFVSAICVTAVGLLMLLVAMVLPPLSAIVDHIVAGNPRYVEANYSRVFLLIAGYILVATVLGWWLGTASADRLVARMQKSSIDRDSSGWGIAFGLHKDTRNIVGVQLKSGAWVQGQLHTFNNRPDDEGSRSLILTGPMKYRAPGQDETVELTWGAVVLASDQIDALFVNYEENAEPDPG